MKDATFYGDGAANRMMIVCSADEDADEDDGSTLETETVTAETAAVVAPVPRALEGEPAYMVEIHPPRRAPTLLAIRATFDEARRVAESLHPAVAEVVVREMPLPCDADSLVRVLGDSRLWSRDADGVWSPPFDESGATQIVGSSS